MEEVRAATGVRDVYRPGGGGRRAERVRELLDGELELREAVEVALLNNPALQGAFRTIGIARADRAQAGMLANPSLSLALRFPTSGGGTVVEGGLLGSLLDLWQLPARVDVADAALRRRVLEVAHRAVSLAGAVRSAYVDAVAAEELQEIAEENRATAAGMLELAEERVAARAATAVDANLARLDLAATDLARRDARLAASEARRALAALLGLESLAADHALVSELAVQPDLPPIDRLADLAERRRLDLRAARQAVERASAELERQRGLVARTVDAGAAAEREGEWTVGPAVRVELPVFDRNRAQVAKAAEALEQRRQLLAALRLDALHEVGSARARAEASRDAVRMSEEILARSREALELARESYRVGNTTVVPVLEAQRSLLRARREHVRRLQQAATAMSDLERATGVPRESLLHARPRRSP